MQLVYSAAPADWASFVWFDLLVYYINFTKEKYEPFNPQQWIK